jgi:hypothetical protein
MIVLEDGILRAATWQQYRLARCHKRQGDKWQIYTGETASLFYKVLGLRPLVLLIGVV